MQDSAQNYVSVIGSSLLQPTVKLMEVLESLNPKGPNEVQASPLKNGYSTAIVALTVSLLESALNRTQYIMGGEYKRDLIKFFRAAFSSSALHETLEELFVVRDAIVHNHVWAVKFKDEEEGMKLVSAQLLLGYGDKKFRKVMDPETRKTRLLRMNLFPTRICRLDAVIALKSAYKILLFLESQDRGYINVSSAPVQLANIAMAFSDFINQIK
jgi:hypothetical protein